MNTTASDHGRLLIISGSLRAERLSPAIARWIAGFARALDFTAVTVLDLTEVSLPDDRLLAPGGGPSTSATEIVAASDAFVIVSPEYNRSYPAGLKRFIDWHYAEWAVKPAMIASYGVRGGHSAADHLRGVLSELSVVTTRRSLGLVAPWADCTDEGYRPDGGEDAACTAALRELLWWSRALLTARHDAPLPE